MATYAHGVHALRTTLLGSGVLSHLILGSDTVRYVATTGNDANDGLTLATAFLTVQRAVNEAPPVFANFYILIATGVYTEAVVVEAKTAGRIWLVGQPMFTHGAWGATETVAAYTEAPAGEVAGRHQVNITNTGAWAFAATDLGKFLVFDFGDNTYEVATIVERIGAQDVFVSGQGAGGGYPTGRNAASYAAVEVVVAEPSVTLRIPAGGGELAVITATGPVVPPSDLGYNDPACIVLEWLNVTAENGLTNSQYAILSQVSVGGDCVRITGAATEDVRFNGGMYSVMGNYIGQIRVAWSLTAAINTLVSTHVTNAAVTVFVADPMTAQAGQRRHAGVFGYTDGGLAPAPTSVEVLYGASARLEGAICGDNVYVGPNSALMGVSTLRIVGTLTIESCNNEQLGRTVIEDGMYVSGSSDFHVPLTVEVNNAAAAAPAVRVSEDSHVSFNALSIIQAVAPNTCITVSGHSSMEVRGALTLNCGALAATGGVVAVTGESDLLVTGATDSSACTAPLNPLVSAIHSSRVTFVGAIMAINGDYGAGGILEAEQCSSIEIAALPVGTYTNTNGAGYGLLMRTGGRVVVPTTYGAAGNDFTGAANAMDLGGAGATAYAAGCQTDIGAGVPELCGKLEV